MTPITRTVSNGTTVQETFDANQSLILMIVNSVEEGLLSMTESQPFLRNALVRLHQDFISHLGKLGVVESIEGLSDSLSDRWMFLDENSCKVARLYGVPMDALRVIDFAFVWAHHLAKVSGTTCDGFSSSQMSTQIKIPSSFALFVTNNMRVASFFNYLLEQKTMSRGSHDTVQHSSCSMCHNLLCIHLDRLNELLREYFPNLSAMLSLPNCFDKSQTPYMDGKEIISASTLRRLIRKIMHDPATSEKEASHGLFSVHDPNILSSQNPTAPPLSNAFVHHFTSDTKDTAPPLNYTSTSFNEERKREILPKASVLTQPGTTNTYTWLFTYIHIYICVCTCAFSIFEFLRSAYK